MRKRALVTGASEGIGHAFAKRLADDGFLVTAVARNEEKLQKLTSDLGEGHSYIVADLSTEAGAEKIAGLISQQHFDLLVNNAGKGAAGKFSEISMDRHKEILGLNINALVRLSHAYLNGARSGDALINVSSVVSFLPMPAIGLYSASKAFVTSFSESLWHDNKSRGIYVMGLCPGMTLTRFNENAGGGNQKAPEFLTQTPEELVETGMKALKCRRRPTVVSGALNNLMVFTSRLMSRKSVVSMMGQNSEKI